MQCRARHRAAHMWNGPEVKANALRTALWREPGGHTWDLNSTTKVSKTKLELDLQPT